MLQTWILDRYILRQFLQVFVICFVSLAGLFIVVDLFANLDEFLRAGEKEGKALAVIAEYYSYQILYFFDRLNGILTMVAAMFTATWFERHNELTAMIAAGVPRGRVFRPVICAALCINLLAAANREFVIPACRERIGRSPQNLLGDNPQDLRPRYDHRTSILFRGESVITAEQRIQKPSFLLPAGLDTYGRQLTAENAFYVPPAPDLHPAGYMFKGVTEPLGLNERASLWLSNEPVIITPRDGQGWLAADECFVASDITFEQLRGGHQWRQYSRIDELIAGLRNASLDFGADVRVAIHFRLLQPALDAVLLLLGLPLVLAGGTRHMVRAIGMCLTVVLAYLAVVFSCEYLGRIYLLEPALATWLPLMFAAPAAAYLSTPLLE